MPRDWPLQGAPDRPDDALWVNERYRLIATVMKLRRIIYIAGRLANRGDSNAQILTFALRDCYHYAVIGPINIR